MNFSAFLAYLRDRLAEPGSHRALALAFGLAGITVSDQTAQIALAVLTLLTTLAAVFLKEQGAAVTAGSTNPISSAVVGTLLDLIGQGPALAGVAKQVYALHTGGSLDADEALGLLGSLNALAAPLAPANPPALPGPTATAIDPIPAPAAPIA